jgi:hypothetical protein
MFVPMTLNSRCCYSKVVVTLLLTSYRIYNNNSCYGNLKYFKFSYVSDNVIKLTLLL